MKSGGRGLMIGAAALLAVGVLVNGGLLAYKLGWLDQVARRFDKPVPDFAATDHRGRPAKFSDHRGRWLVVFFGYTHCPDVCPQSMADLAKALRGLGPDASKVQGLLVSVDPARDTTGKLAGYVDHFKADLAGWRVEPSVLPGLAATFGATYSYGVGAESGSVAHPTAFYLVDPRGVLAKEPVAPPITSGDLRARLEAGR